MALYVQRATGLRLQYAMLDNLVELPKYADLEYYVLQQTEIQDVQAWLVFNQGAGKALVNIKPATRFLLVLSGENSQEWLDQYFHVIEKANFVSWTKLLDDKKFTTAKWLNNLHLDIVIREEIENWNNYIEKEIKTRNFEWIE